MSRIAWYRILFFFESLLFLPNFIANVQVLAEKQNNSLSITYLFSFDLCNATIFVDTMAYS